MRAILVPIGLAGLLLSASGVSAQETFEYPEIDGRRLDLCLVWGGRCGKPAADAFCRERGFAEAREWKPALDIGAATPTLVLSDRRLCDAPGCDGFASIACQGERQRLRPLPPGALRAVAARPPDEPVPVATAEPWTTQDVIDERIDVQAQFALMRMLAGEPPDRGLASAVLTAIVGGDLAGVYREDRRAPALRARGLGTGWWTLVPPGRVAVCVTAPETEPPMIAVRRGAEKDPDAYDRGLAEAWAECGLPAAPPRPYVETLPPRPVSTEVETGCAYPQADGQINVHVYDADTGDAIEGVEVIYGNESRPGFGWPRLRTDLLGYAVVAPAPPGRYRIAAIAPEVDGEQVYAAVGVDVDQPHDCRRNVHVPLPPWEEPITME